MPIRIRRYADRYLHELAAEPLFRGVPRHLIAQVGRMVDPVVLAGAVASFDPMREVMLIAEGHVFVADSRGRPIATVGPLGAIGGLERNVRERRQIVAASSARAYVVDRRELATLARLAPSVAAALAHDAPANAILEDAALLPAVTPTGSAPRWARASRS